MQVKEFYPVLIFTDLVNENRDKFDKSIKFQH